MKLWGVLWSKTTTGLLVMQKRRAPIAALGMAVLCSTLYMGVSFVSAQSINVTASVPAPLPSGPAIITSHHDQQHVETGTIQVEGTCSVDTAYVEIYRNDVTGGVGACSGGHFSIPLSLLAGANKLQAQGFNNTSQKGPTSPSIVVYYDIVMPPPPVAPIQNISPVSPIPSQLTPVIPFFATCDDMYQIVTRGESWTCKIAIFGGTGPYRVEINWGDGVSTSFRTDANRRFVISHVFTKAGIYNPVVKIIDANNAVTVLQLLVIVRASGEEVAPETDSKPDYVATYIVPAVTAATLLVVTIRSKEIIWSLRRLVNLIRPK